MAKEYIEREAVCYQLEKQETIDGQPRAIRRARRIVEDYPAADVVPVRHGRWVTKKDACGRDYTICSACETEIQWRDRRGVILKVDMQTAPYCPNCGADMRISSANCTNAVTTGEDKKDGDGE